MRRTSQVTDFKRLARIGASSRQQHQTGRNPSDPGQFQLGKRSRQQEPGDYCRRSTTSQNLWQQKWVHPRQLAYTISKRQNFGKTWN